MDLPFTIPSPHRVLANRQGIRSSVPAIAVHDPTLKVKAGVQYGIAKGAIETSAYL